MANALSHKQADEGNIFSEKYFEYLFIHARNMQGSTLRELTIFYADYPFCLTEFHEDGKTDNSMEVRFDRQCATLVAYLGQGRQCIQVFIYPDHPYGQEECVRYLNNIYEYNDEIGYWEVPGGKLLCEFDDRWVLIYN